MYREAMEHLMAVPPSKTTSTTCRLEEETKLGVTSTDSCGGEDKPADAGRNGKEASNTTTTTTVRNDEVMDGECIIRGSGGGRGIRCCRRLTWAETLA